MDDIESKQKDFFFLIFAVMAILLIVSVGTV
jgi:hypothetical protein